MCPGFQRVDDELVDAFSAVGGVDIHKATVGVVGVFEVVAGGVDAGIARADEGALGGFGDEEVDMGGGEHTIEVIVMDGAVLNGGVHGAFGADDSLFKAQEGRQVGGRSRSR